jgi:hypothetical protein
MIERDSAGRTSFVIQIIFVESDVLRGQRRTGQWTRSRVIHINARSLTCSLKWRIVEAVAKCSVRVVTGLGDLVAAVFFPDGKRLFSTHTVETSSRLNPAFYPTDVRVFF